MEQKCEYSRVKRSRDKLPTRIGMLSCRAEELESAINGVRIINPAVGTRVVTPSPSFNVIAEGLLGLLLGLALAFGLDYLRRADASSAG